MDTLTEVRQQILGLIKTSNGATTAEVAEHVGTSYEAVRQQLVQLERDGLIERALRRAPGAGAGRPVSEYCLSARGEDLFPKAYDALAVEMLDTVVEQLGPDALRSVLAAMTRDRVDRWSARLEGLSLPEKLDMLADLYRPHDEFTEVLHDGTFPQIVERNCPFHNIASQRPALCSVTIRTLEQLLGYRVERIKRLQRGDGRCVFQIRTDQPIAHHDGDFELEDA